MKRTGYSKTLEGTVPAMSRREFLSRTASGVAVLSGALGTGGGSLTDREWGQSPARRKESSALLPARLGRYYEAEVPDTLDLAERARLGLNHLMEGIREERDYEMFYPAHFPAVAALPCCQPKMMEAMAMLRIMSGSQQNLAREAGMVEMMASLLGEDGLYWVSGKNKPWISIAEPFAYIHGQGRMLQAMTVWHQYTDDPAWRERCDRMVDGLDRVLAVHKEDYAYIPVRGWMDQEYYRSCYIKGRGWKDTTEPQNEKFGEEGSLFNHQGHIPGALARWYLRSGNKQALRLSSELVRFYTKPQFWADWPGGEYPGVVGAQHGHFAGHFCGQMNVLRAILEYAVAVNDPRLKAFVRDGYEWARQQWIVRFGYWGDGQGTGPPRLLGLALKLCYAGVGDYWEDVDQYVRNHVTEYQITAEDILRKQGEDMPPGEPHMTADEAVRRLEEKNKMPAFNQPGMQLRMTDADLLRVWVGATSADPFKNVLCPCCSPHGAMGLFYAWDGTLRYADGVAQVNLLLNRASPWMDMDSYLPYEGKVVLRNKSCREAFVRIPLWVEKRTVGCHVGGRIVRPEWFGRYLRFEHLRAGDVITIEFPVVERTEEWRAPGILRGDYPGRPGIVTYTCRFRGNTLVELSPELLPGSPLYQQRPKQYGSTTAPITRGTRFTAPLVLTSYV